VTLRTFADYAATLGSEWSAVTQLTGDPSFEAGAKKMFSEVADDLRPTLGLTEMLLDLAPFPTSSDASISTMEFIAKLLKTSESLRKGRAAFATASYAASIPATLEEMNRIAVHLDSVAIELDARLTVTRPTDDEGIKTNG